MIFQMFNVEHFSWNLYQKCKNGLCLTATSEKHTSSFEMEMSQSGFSAHTSKVSVLSVKCKFRSDQILTPSCCLIYLIWHPAAGVPCTTTEETCKRFSVWLWITEGSTLSLSACHILSRFDRDSSVTSLAYFWTHCWVVCKHIGP